MGQFRDGLRQTFESVSSRPELSQLGQVADRVREPGQLVVLGSQFDELTHGPHGLWELGEAVLADVEVRQPGQPSKRRGELRQPVVVQVQAVGEGWQLTHFVGHCGERVVAQIQRA